MNTFVVCALYKFTPLPQYESLQKPLTELCQESGILGTLLLASEGINGTLAGSREAIDGLLSWLNGHPELGPVEHKESYTDSNPFHRIKVRLKKEIVTLGVPGTNPSTNGGEHVKPAEWDQLIRDPDVTLIDVRNDYEIAIGSFEGAVNPHTESFRDFPDYVEKNLDPQKNPKIAMFCTGGIRCEKASAFMRDKGFDEVYQLHGGILKYLEDIPEEQRSWNGECFVFDNRVSVNGKLESGSYDMCHGCRQPLSEADKESSDYVPGVTCPKCAQARTADQQRRSAERQHQMELARERKQPHLGPGARPH